MENKTKHRILGVMVILGLIVILMPLFDSSSSDPKSEVALVSSPPFPDQAVTLDNSDIQQPIQTQQVASQNAATQAPDMSGAPHPDDATLPLAAADVSSNKVLDGADIAANPMAIPPRLPAETTSSLNAEPSSAEEVGPSQPLANTDSNDQGQTQPGVTEKSKVKSTAVKAADIKKSQRIEKDNKASLAAIKKSVAVVDQLSKLKQAAWVIQVGSYKNKANALRLVNQLRSNGYTAFIQDVSSEEGRHTRVYVGPESKRKAALSLVDQINKEMNLQGIVISYQPLAI
jgi:DedD protein